MSAVAIVSTPALDERFRQLAEATPPFPPAAFRFVLAALVAAIGTLPERKHITGPQLAHSVRALALQCWGVLAGTVLAQWNIHTTDDIGRVVFALVDAGLIAKTNSDRIDDFRDIYAFSEAFDPAHYRWPTVDTSTLRSSTMCGPAQR